MGRSDGIWAESNAETYIRALRMMNREALPRAVAESLNAPAEAIEKEAKRNVERRLTVRTKFTTNSIRQDRHARGNNFARMHSRVGTLSPYLPIQDEGGVIEADRDKLPLPTLAARTGRNPRKSIARRYAMNRLGEFGSGGRFFIGTSRRGRTGIYERLARRVRMIRSLEETRVRIPPTRWYSDPLAKYGNRHFIGAQFKRAAQRELRKVTRRTR